MAMPATQPVDIGSAISYGWRKLWENLGPLVLAGLLVFVITGLVNLLVRSAQGESVILQVLFGALNYLVGAIIAMGWVKMALAITRGEKVEAMDVLRTSEFLVQYVIASILFSLMLTVGLILFVIPGIWVALTFGFYSWVVVDKRAEAIEALRRSADITRGHKWQLLGFFIVLILLNIVGLLVFVVGVLFTAAMSLLATAYVYRRLSGDPVVEVAEPGLST